MTKPQSEAERMSEEYARINYDVDADRKLASIDYLAGFKAAIEQAEKLSAEVANGERAVWVASLKQLLEPRK